MISPGIKKTKKICIIGSGPSGVAALKPFLKYRDKFEVTLISRGNLDFYKYFNKKIFTITKLTKDQKHDYWMDQKNNSNNLIPKKLFFNSFKIYNNKNSDFFVEKNINFDVSYQIGGLSNVWGANVCDISDNDLKKYKKNIEYKEGGEPFFKTITSDIKIAGQKDSIDNSLNNIVYQKKKLNYSSQAKNLQKLFKKNYYYFKKKNFRLGYAKLAINTESEINECENCGLCMFGCHKHSIYNSTYDIKKNLAKLNFIENTKVENIKEINKKVQLNLINEKTKKKFTLDFDKVLVAAGAIDTSIIVLKFLEKYNKRTLTIKDSSKYFFLYFTKKRLKNEQKETIGLSQIFIQTEIETHTFHLQLYDSNILFKIILKKIFNRIIVDKIFKFLNFIFDRLMVGVIYFPSEISDEMIITKKNKTKFFIKKKNYKNYFIYKLLIKLFQNSTKLGSFPLPFFLKGKTGISQHFGSSVPMSNTSEIGECDPNGLLIGSKNIYIVDSSCLTRIPSTPPTFLTMSNAMRISSKIIENNVN